MLTKLLRSAAIGFAALCGGLLAIAAPLPNVPSSPNFSEASQIVGTLNAVIGQLNGGTGYSGTAQLVSIGQFCANTAGATPQTCNGQRGIASFTGVTAAANTNATAQVINNSFVTAASNCQANIVSSNAAGASGPVVSTVIAGAGTITIIITNATATTTGSSTFGFGFNCT